MKETTPADELRSRRLFARFFYLFELIAFRSKWLATLVSLVLFYSIYVLNRNPDVNLLVFSCLYLLMLFLSSVLSLKNWLQSDNKLSFDYIPGIYSIVTLLYALLRKSDFDQVLPRSILYFLLMWVWHFAYQSYKIKPYLPDIARPMKHLAIFGLLLAGMSFKFPSLIDFLVGKGIILLLLYKACVTAIIAYRLWRDDYKSSDWLFKKLKNITS
ncbi:hypothetical protein ACVRYP_04700 [Streptococcus rifensis]